MGRINSTIFKQFSECSEYVGHYRVTKNNLGLHGLLINTCKKIFFYNLPPCYLTEKYVGLYITYQEAYMEWNGQSGFRTKLHEMFFRTV